jgi:hypothetical protein
MNTIVEVQLEWNYSPKNYIEEPILIKEDSFELSISDGKALAKITPSCYVENPDIKEYLTSLVNSRFHAVQILSHKDFNLSKPSRSDLRNDGSKNIFLEVESGVIVMSSRPVDLVVKDKDGNVISDSKQERLNKQKWAIHLRRDTQ